MRYPEFVRSRLKPGQAIVDEMPADDADMLHCAIGVAGEVMELVEGLQECIHGETEEAQAKADENVIEELGDIEFFLCGLRLRTNIIRQPEPGPGELPRMSVWTATIAAVVAAGHILDAVKKTAVYRKPLDHERLELWMNRLDVALAIIRCGRQVEWMDIIERNYAKLTARHPSGAYSNEAQTARADEGVKE